ncbi:antibiotic biosynthesis monooxygenase [Rhodospirillaceae bacterium SYSU D60014]|uniref:antibiotic biosynthesis monooxygenase n=1 Tax=Virgifigura deserti TaxID=2268457 RepID=UPI000E66FCC3
MTTTANPLPDITRPDVGTVLVSPWLVDTPERQQAAVEATIAAWESAPWPHGFLSLSCFVSSDGETVLNYAQWTSDEAHHEFVRTQRPTLVRGIDDAVPGIERPGVVRYRLYRSHVSDGPPRTADCIVIISIQANGPERARQWIDTVLDALKAETDPHAGLISAHFHISIDGTRILNYAEWTDEQAHREALERSGPGTIGSAPAWRQVQTMPGVTHIGFKRYRLQRSLSPSR